MDSLVQQATGFLVTYADGELRQWDLRDSLQEARDAYSMPPIGWRSIGLSACKDGVPFCQLAVPIIQYVRPLSVAARDYGLSPTQFCAIRLKRAWKHIGDES